MHRLAKLQNDVLGAVEDALREGEHVDVGSLGSFNAGIAAIVGQGRIAADAELLALEHLADRITDIHPQEGEAPETAGEEQSSQGSVTQPGAANPAPAESSHDQLTDVVPPPILPPVEAQHLFGAQVDEDDGA